MYIVSMGDFMVTEACSVLDAQEQRAAWKVFDESEAHYRRIFDGAHVALWDQDFSRLVARLEELRADGVDDIRGYFQMHPEATADAVKLVHVRDVNVYAMELFEAHDKVELTGDLGATFLPETSEVFLDEIVALWEGRKRFESEAHVRTLKGQHLEILLTIAWEGKNCEHSLVSILDISRQKAVQRRFQTLNNVAHIVSSDLELERVVQAVTDNATSLSGAEFGAFFYNLNDAKGERLTLYTLSGAPREAFERFGVPRNTSVFEPTFRGEGIVRSDDIRKDARYGHNEPHHGMPKGHLPVVSYLAVPVVSRSSEVLGGLFSAIAGRVSLPRKLRRSWPGSLHMLRWQLITPASCAPFKMNLSIANRRNSRPGGWLLSWSLRKMQSSVRASTASLRVGIKEPNGCLVTRPWRSLEDRLQRCSPMS